MRVKRYIVEHMPDAMQRIRGELGRDAVILSTKEIKIGGFLGMFTKKRIEVVAAVEKEAQAITSPARPNKQASAKNELSAVNSIKGVPNAGLSTLSVPNKAVPAAYKRTNDVLKAGMNDVARDLELSSISVAATSEMIKEEQQVEERRQLEPERPTHEASIKMIDQKVSDDPLLKEIKEMKLWMAKMAKHSMMKEELPESLQKIQEQLIQQEVDIHLRAEWIEAACEKWEDSERSLTDEQLHQFIYDKAFSFLENRLGGGINSTTKIVYVAGPTGVGKTTTIAKLAAEQLFRYQRKVGFITSDTYRISAVEQLRTYASILNVPLEVVQSPGDMQRAMQRLDYCDLILMDTAGRNYRNELLVSELQSLLSHAGDSETYLVLSLTSKSQDMVKITEHFSKYGLDKVIFTKQDETGSYGPIFNLLNNFPLHLSYMTNGQNVPDDLMMPNQKMLCDLLLGERKDES
ncbi:flagellar biosynthesis protein FlhF [Paenibacillus macquariensis]|uniref:Flagellar biosynthesis protein FlhF n=1 Tax=Paenibacillus macquariensis TaxID=948756 RepID=A0ABY1JZS8_9BACL|nr:flagellar biosynthesis protein FlhF [Paenibacillus macquariensis]MEC0091389.1 flagellar biosynthesis protein FlhF [Paenibacillus macquariensis]OAB38072.1 flagellar biosynthesis protein FlhF [Paenibacillus macquariensis subsp. macquariensis]SIR05698.1 flagellar biosynthesis protein FlhF [Paenibacillus macquariensis]